MHVLPKLLAFAATTAALVVGVAAPASATPDPCPGGETICVYTNGATVPIGNPVVLAPTGVPASAYPGPTICDSNGGNCKDSFILLPGAIVSSTGSSPYTLNIPGFGLGIDGTGHPTVYFTAPWLGVGSFPLLGVSVQVYVPIQPVVVDPLTKGCPETGPTGFGPVSVSTTRSCYAVVSFDA